MQNVRLNTNPTPVQKSRQIASALAEFRTIRFDLYKELQTDGQITSITNHSILI